MEEELKREREDRELMRERVRKMRANEMSKAEEEMLTQQQQFIGRYFFNTIIFLW